MLMVPTHPTLLVADLQDRAGQDLGTTRRAKARTAQGVGNLGTCIARVPSLANLGDHSVIPGDMPLVHDRWNDRSLRDMAADPDNLDGNAVGGRPVDNDPGDQA